MIGKIILIFLGLFVQEIISINALVFATHHGLYPALLIHVLFVVATLFDIGIGFLVGKFLKKKTLHTKVTVYIQKLSDRFALGTNKYRRWIALLLLGNFSFPYVNSCIAAYLGMPFWESSFFIFVGDVVWYGTVWLIVLGVSSAIKNVYIAFAVVLVIALLIMFLVNRFKGKKV